MPHIDRQHPRRAALAQHLGESSGRCAHVEAQPTGDIDPEGVERGDQLVRRAADVMVGCRDDHVLLVSDTRRGLDDGTAVDRDETGIDQLGGVGAGASEPAFGDDGVEALRHADPSRGPDSSRRASSSCNAV